MGVPDQAEQTYLIETPAVPLPPVIVTFGLGGVRRGRHRMEGVMWPVEVYTGELGDRGHWLAN